MSSQTTRRFRLSDALVLVAATAVGLALCRWWDSSEAFLEISIHEVARDLPWHTYATSYLPAIAGLLLSPWVAALLCLRLVPPRPQSRCLWDQPGFLACVAVLVAIAWGLAVDVAAIPRIVASGAAWREVAWPVIAFSPYIVLRNAGAFVAVAWLTSRAGGRWRPEPSWLDRTGRVLGVAWIVTSLAASADEVMMRAPY